MNSLLGFPFGDWFRRLAAGFYPRRGGRLPEGFLINARLSNPPRADDKADSDPADHAMRQGGDP
jgi:hypothetical protein